MIDIILPMLVLLIFTAIVAYISSIIYKKVIMNYGTRIKGMALLKELFKRFRKIKKETVIKRKI